jgi:signal transduction histidine kinase
LHEDRRRRAIEHMLQKPPPAAAAEAEVCRAQRMQIVGQLTGGVVHDFNNILTVFTGTVEILEEAVADRPELAAIARLIDEAAARGASLTRTCSRSRAAGRRSEAGRGTSVEICLPKAASLARSAAEDSGRARIEGGDQAILIVEDDVLLRTCVITQVQSLGCRASVTGRLPLVMPAKPWRSSIGAKTSICCSPT